MSDASIPLSPEPASAVARFGRTRRSRLKDEPTTSDDAFLEHYFKRIEPEVAASFTETQREAIRTMFGARGIARHTVELRRSIPFGSKRFYLVLLFGPERRGLARLYSQGQVSRPFNLLVYLGLAGLFMVPILGLALVAGL